MNSILRNSMLSVASLVFTGGAIVGPAVAAQAAPAESRTMSVRSEDGRGDNRGERGGDRGRDDDRDRRRDEGRAGFEYQAQPNYFFCGPASTRIALSADGKIVSQEELAEKLGTTEAGTDSAIDITRVLNDFTGGKYKTTEIGDDVATPEQIDRLRADVVDAVDAGEPVVANVLGGAVDTDGREHFFPGHYIAVVGYQDAGDIVRIADPADPAGEYSMELDELANWIAGRGYSS